MILPKISEAIYELQAMNCKREDMIIAFSPLIERFIIEELNTNYPINVAYRDVKELKYEGVVTYRLHPYNEIVVYDSVNCYYNPDLIIKIQFNESRAHHLYIQPA